MDDYGDDAPDMGIPRASPLPWVLFGLTVLLAAVIAVVLMIKVDAEKSQKLENARLYEEANKRANKAEEERRQLDQQNEQLRGDNAALKNEVSKLNAQLAASSSPGKKTTAAATSPPPSKGKKSHKKHH